MTKRNDFLRLLALLIDSLFVSFISSFLFNFVVNTSLSTRIHSFEVFCLLLYFIVFDLRNDGQTLGMILTKITPTKRELKNRISHSFLKTMSIVVFPITILVYLIKGKIIHDLLEDKNESVYLE